MSGAKKAPGILKTGLILCAITFGAALMLGVVNELTYEKIAELSQEAAQAAMQRVLPDAEMTEAPFEPTSFADLGVGGSGQVTAVYQGERNGLPAGCCVYSEPKGFGGAISLVVGVDADGKVTGVVISEHSETPGLGAKAEDQLWLNQFDGKTGPFTIKKSGVSEENDIQALTGATNTSNAVKNGVEAAIAAAAQVGGKEAGAR